MSNKKFKVIERNLFKKRNNNWSKNIKNIKKIKAKSNKFRKKTMKIIINLNNKIRIINKKILLSSKILN